MIGSLITSLAAPLFSIIDQAVTDTDQRARLKADLQRQMLDQTSALHRAAAGIITAEAQGESWIQRSWRPLVMLGLTGLVGAHWLGWTAPGLPPEQVADLYLLVQIGLGGYIGGRSAEKIAAIVTSGRADKGADK